VPVLVVELGSDTIRGTVVDLSNPNALSVVDVIIDEQSERRQPSMVERGREERKEENEREKEEQGEERAKNKERGEKRERREEGRRERRGKKEEGKKKKGRHRKYKTGWFFLAQRP